MYGWSKISSSLSETFFDNLALSKRTSVHGAEKPQQVGRCTLSFRKKLPVREQIVLVLTLYRVDGMLQVPRFQAKGSRRGKGDTELEENSMKKSSVVSLIAGGTVAVRKHRLCPNLKLPRAYR
jgi:hypothetical protein